MIETGCIGAGAKGPGTDGALLWASAPADLTIAPEEIHIWQAFLDPGSKNVQAVWKNLSPDEMLRAGRFRFVQDAGWFIAARGTLRLILSRYLEVAPGSIRFRYEKGGKPRLDDAFCKTHIQFNLSRSEGLALFALTRKRPVGVDVEYVRHLEEMESIVGQFFSEKKRALFAKLPEDEKREKFFEWWTLAEALSKALGDGLASDTGRLDAPPAYGDWTTRTICPAPGFAGAVAAEGQGAQIRCWQWRNPDSFIP